MKIRTLIVDDEPLARERIRLLLRAEPDIELLTDCTCSSLAVSVTKSEAPELLFLDVEMPGQDGFAVLRAIPRERLPVVIFTTAYSEHALRAFDAHALDYLLKPFKPARFKEAVQRAREHLANKQAGTAAPGVLDLLNPGPKHYLTRLTVKTEDKVVIIKASDIDAIESAGNYIEVHLGKDSHILRETLNTLERYLDPKRFLRISRSAIVNLDRIKELLPMFKGEHVVVLHNGKRIAMTRRLREVEQKLRFS